MDEVANKTIGLPTTTRLRAAELDAVRCEYQVQERLQHCDQVCKAFGI